MVEVELESTDIRAEGAAASVGTTGPTVGEVAGLLAPALALLGRFRL